MPKVLTASSFWLFYTIVLVSFAFSLFFYWGLMVTAFFLIFWGFRLSGWEAKLNDRDRRLYLLTLLIYAPAESAVQWLGTRGLIPSDFTWVNRLEHLCWAAMLSLIFLPMLTDIWQRLARWQSFLFIVGFVCLLGNVNEGCEFVTRLSGRLNEAQFARFYIDSIYDMTMNLLGGIVGFGLYLAFASKTTQREVQP